MNPKSNSDLFIDRHLGLKANDEKKMLQKIGFNNIDEFINQVIPADIQLKEKYSDVLPKGCSVSTQLKLLHLHLISFHGKRDIRRLIP